MAAVVRSVVRMKNWLKMAWERQPVLVVSVAMGTLGPVYTVFNPGAWKREEELLYWPDRYILPSTKIEKPDYWKRLRQEHLVKWEESLVPWPFYHIKWSEIRVPWPFQKSEK